MRTSFKLRWPALCRYIVRAQAWQVPTRIRGTQNSGGTDADTRHPRQWRHRRGYEAPKTTAARQHQCAPQNQVIRDPRITFGVVDVNVNNRSVSADACAFIPNYLLGVNLFNTKCIVEG